jgi:hypothetical protein
MWGTGMALFLSATKNVSLVQNYLPPDYTVDTDIGQLHATLPFVHIFSTSGENFKIKSIQKLI